MPPIRRLVLPVWALGWALLVGWPLLAGPGYLMLRDAVSTPRAYLTDTAWGLGDTAARAVPQDVAVGVLSMLVDGGLVVRALTFGALFGAGLGAARLVRRVLPHSGSPGRMAAAAFAIANPYVVERLLLGHWSLLLGYAALCHVVVDALGVRAGRRGAWPRLALGLAVAALTPTGALLAGVVALAVVASGAPDVRTAAGRMGAIVALLVMICAPWVVPSVMASITDGGASGSDPAGVAAFAVRAEGTGTLGALLGLGGAWNSLAVPDVRDSWWAWPSLAAVSTLLALGVRALWRRRAVLGPLVVLAAAGVLLPAAAATEPGQAALRWAVVAVPGAGLLRDAHKWVALALPAYVVAVAATTAWLRARLDAAGAVVAVSALVLATVPTAPVDVAPLRPVPHSTEWTEVVAALVSADRDAGGGSTGDVAVLPSGQFRRFDGVGGRRDAVVLDPAPRMLPAEVVTPGDLLVSGTTVAGESGRATRVERALLDGRAPAALAAEGIGWVLVERRSGGDRGASPATLAAAEKVWSGRELELYRIADPAPRTRPPRPPAYLAHGAWLLVLIGGAAGALTIRRPAGRTCTLCRRLSK